MLINTIVLSVFESIITMSDDVQKKIDEIESEIARTQKNKATVSEDKLERLIDCLFLGLT